MCLDTLAKSYLFLKFYKYQMDFLCLSHNPNKYLKIFHHICLFPIVQMNCILHNYIEQDLVQYCVVNIVLNHEFLFHILTIFLYGFLLVLYLVIIYFYHSPTYPSNIDDYYQYTVSQMSYNICNVIQYSYW